MRTLIRYLKDERGVESLEYIAVGAAIVALALLVYGGSDGTTGLAGAINGVIDNIKTKLTATP